MRFSVIANIYDHIEDWTREEPIAKQKHFVNSKTRLEPPEKGLTSDPSNPQAVNEMMTAPLAVDSLDLEGPPSVPGVWPFWMEGQMYSPPKDEWYVAPYSYYNWKPELDERVESPSLQPVDSILEEGRFGAASYYDWDPGLDECIKRLGWRCDTVSWGKFTV
ncbi:hypothetical protein WG66_011329 [Moniliophthora roreri]|nr:hypothetical protein WG66_011329 [Moniliophthora roreri]